MDKKIYDRVELELNPVILGILIEKTDSDFLSRRISENAIKIFTRAFNKLYNLRLRESNFFKVEFDKESAINFTLLPAINKTITFIKESLIEEEISSNQIDIIVRNLNVKLKGKLKSNLFKILSGGEIKDKVFREVLVENSKYLNTRDDYMKEDLIQRVKSSKNLELERFFGLQEGKDFLENLSRLNDQRLIDKLFSNNSILLESVINLSFSIDCKDENPLEILSRSLGLLRMITDNPKVINSIKKKPKLLKLFKDKNYDLVVGNNARDLSDIFVKIPNRISKSNIGQINISNDDYSKLGNTTKKYIDDYRTIMSDYYPENLVDVFESKVYSAIAEGLKEDELDDTLRKELIEHFSNYYLDIFNRKKNQNIYENKMNSELGKYFINNSTILNAHKYALKGLNKYILSEGLFDKLKKSLFGGKVSSGMAGKFNNWFKNTTVMKYMKKVSNAMNDDIDEWEKKLNPNQKKMFNDYPHLKAIFATGGLDINLATHLIQNKSVLKLLNEKPNLAVIIANNPKVADLLLKRDKRLLPKVLANPEIFDWLEDNEQLAGKILNGNSSHLQVLQACILNFELATKIGNDEKIISEVGLENIVDLAELMNSSSDLAGLLDQLDPKEFKELAGLLFKKPELLDFLQFNHKGKELVKLAKTDSNDIIVNAIIDNPDIFRKDSDITKIEGNLEYNKLLSKHLAKFKDNREIRDRTRDSEEDSELRSRPKTSESEYLSIWNGLGSDRRDKIRDFVSKYKVDDCNLTNIDLLKRGNSSIPQLSTDRNGIFWIYKEGNEFKVVVNAELARIKINSDSGYKYLFKPRGSLEGNSILAIKPAIFKKEGDTYSLVRKGRIKLDTIR